MLFLFKDVEYVIVIRWLWVVYRVYTSGFRLW